MKLPEIKERLEAAYEQLIPIRGNLEGDFPLDTALALGELTGVLVKAWGLVKRDMEAKGDG